MKSTIITLSLAAIIGLGACNKTEKKTIAFNELPQAAQTFVNTHFANKQIAVVYHDTEVGDRDYEVRFTDGANIDFTKQGEWDEVEDRDTNGVPTAIIPTAINEYVATKHAGQYVVQIGKDRNEYDVELNSTVEITFDKNGSFVRYDD